MSLMGLVVIGRNEGARLLRCLASVDVEQVPVVYVDSGSDDGSPAAAGERGALVVSLDVARPFTAARARNAGARALLARHPDLTCVQFVDGDCELAPGWLATARATLEQHPEVAVVCGRRRERHPEASPYNRLCDLEWDTPVGEARSCGGDALVRVAAFREVGGFDPGLIAGEEPELCFRLRASGWRVLRLPAEMTRHDAAMTRLSQWWRRALRAGHAYAENGWMHAPAPDRFGAHATLSNWTWGLGLPLAGLALGATTGGWGLALLALYGVQVLRVARGARSRGQAPDLARLWALSCTLGKLPMALGQARFHLARLAGRRGALIEYK